MQLCELCDNDYEYSPGIERQKPTAMLGIRIRMFLDLLDPDPHPLVRGTDPDQGPDPSLFS